MALKLKSKASKQFRSHRVTLISYDNLKKPGRSDNQYCQQLIRVPTAGKSISCCVFRALLVDDLVLETKEFGKQFLLPRSVKPVLIKVNQTPLIHVNEEFTLQ